MKILKFGQSTLKDADSFSKVLAIVAAEAKGKQEIHIVASALNQVPERLQKISQLAMVGDDSYKPILKNIEDEHFTIVKKFIDVKRQAKVLANLKVILNDLEEILYGVYLLWELSPRTMDHINCYGVKIGAYLLTECIKETNVDADYLDAQQLIVTNNKYGNAEIDRSATEKKIKNYFSKSKKLTVVTGHIGATAKGESTTLGKAGNSLTASILASVLNAKALDIYTDRDGISNADVDLVNDAFSLSTISYAEAMELSNFGTNVIYPPSLQPAFNKEIPITIYNLYNPKFKGTVISKKGKSEKLPIKASSSIRQISLLNIQGSGMVGVTGVAGRVFSALATNKINVVLITQASSEHSITLAISPEDGETASNVLKNEFAEEIKQKKIDKIALKEKMAILAVIGDNMQQTPGIAGKVFSSLGNHKINIAAIAQGSSELNISIVLENKELKKALNVLQQEFFKN
jgi:aspartokinase/homoserine dehydrogenase 1